MAKKNLKVKYCIGLLLLFQLCGAMDVENQPSEQSALIIQGEHGQSNEGVQSPNTSNRWQSCNSTRGVLKVAPGYLCAIGGISFCAYFAYVITYE